MVSLINVSQAFEKKVVLLFFREHRTLIYSVEFNLNGTTNKIKF